MVDAAADLPGEVWRCVVGQEDRYEVSNFGRVRTKPQILKAFAIPTGHLSINLGARRRTYVHRLVAEAFLAPDAARVLVNHKDGNPANNSVENLEWCTPGENIAHGYRVNGRRSPACRRMATACPKTGEIMREYHSGVEAAKAHGVSKTAAYYAANKGSVCAGVRWLWL